MRLNRFPEIIMVMLCVLICIFLCNGCKTKVSGGTASHDTGALSVKGGETSATDITTSVVAKPNGEVLISFSRAASATTQPSNKSSHDIYSTTQPSVETDQNVMPNLAGVEAGEVGGLSFKQIKNLDPFKNAWMLGLILIAAGVGLYFLGNVTGAFVVGILGVVTILYPAIVVVGGVAALVFFGWSYYKTNKAGKQTVLGVKDALAEENPETVERIKTRIEASQDTDSKLKVSAWKKR